MLLQWTKAAQTKWGEQEFWKAGTGISGEPVFVIQQFVMWGGE